MKKKTLSIFAALFMCACGAWAQVTAITDGATYRVRSNNDTNYYWSATTTPVAETEAGLFKFVAVAGKEGAYTIQALSNNNQWLTYTVAGSYSNQQNWMTFGETAGEFKAEYVTGTGDGATGVEGFVFAPANSTGWASKYLNWFNGIDKNTGQTLGLYQNKETDKGSIWTLEEYVPATVSEAEEAYLAAEGEIYEFVEKYSELSESNEEVYAVIEDLTTAIYSIFLSEEPTAEEYEAATATIKAALKKAQADINAVLSYKFSTVEDNGIYAIVNVQPGNNHDWYLNVNNGNATVTDASDFNANSKWPESAQFIAEVQDNGKVAFKSVANNGYLAFMTNKINTNGALSETIEEWSSFTLTNVDATANTYRFVASKRNSTYTGVASSLIITNAGAWNGWGDSDYTQDQALSTTFGLVKVGTYTPTTPDVDADLEAAKAEYTAASAAIGEFMAAYGANANEDIQAVLEAFNEALSAIHLSENPTVDEYKAATATINDAISKAQTEVDEILGNVDSDLLAAQKALDDYMQNVVLPLMEEIQELDENSDEYKALETEIAALSEAFGDYLSTPNPTDVEGCTALLESFKVLVKDYEEVKSQLEPDAETDLDKAKAAYEAAVDEYLALIEQYGPLANTSTEAHDIIETLNTSIKWVVDKDATADDYNTATNSIKTGVEAAAEALEEIAGSTPTVAHFPEAGEYYVTFTGQASGRKNHLYNDLTQADGYTLQSDAPETVTNNYVWRVVADGSKMTLVNGQGSTMKLCSGSDPVIDELGYEAHNNAYYLFVTAQNLHGKDDNCLNVSDGGYKNAAGTPAVTTWTTKTTAGANAGDNHWAVTEVGASSVYNVVVEGNDEGYAILGNEYAANNGFFLTTSTEGVEAKEISHYSYTVDVEEETKTIKVTYTATEDPINVTYKVFVGEELVCGYEKTEYVGDAISFNTVIPEYVEVTADIPETVPTEGIVEIHTSYKEGALPFDVNGNYNLALNRTPNLNIFVDANNGIHTEAVASTEETEDNYVWTIGGDWYNGFTLKSVAADKYVSFGTANPAKDNTHATLVESADGEGATFDLVTKDGMNYFKLHGTTNNAYISNCGGTKTTYLTNWNNAGNIGDAGAQFIFTKVESTPEVDELAEALDFFYESAEATLQYLRTNYGAAVAGLKAEDAIEELNALIVGLKTFKKPTTMEEIEEAFDAVSDAALKFYDSCTITVLSRVISEAKEGEETEPTTLEKVKEIEDAILAKYGISALSNKK